MTSLREQLLATTSAPKRTVNPDKDFTRQLEVSSGEVNATLRGPAAEVTDDAARAFLEAKGLDPDAWVVTGFRSSEWTMANGETGVSTRYTFKPSDAATPTVPIDELIDSIKAHKRAPLPRPTGDAGFVVAIGDMQFGKIDGDGIDGTLERTILYLDKAADSLEHARKRHEIGHVHLAWLGDHIEGFVSQGGANVWRTQLTLSEQVRLTRRVMAYGMELFAPLATRVTMAAVPGNHGESQRFSGKGVTRYDDSHDTEALVAVADAAKYNPGAFGHVEFYTPDTDEMTVVLDVAGTVVGHAHGHQWRPGKHFDWWEGQSFGTSQLAQADLLLAGHLHHEFMEARGRRLFVQVPALESESTWYRHATGVTGNPGLITAVTQDGVTSTLEIVR